MSGTEATRSLSACCSTIVFLMAQAAFGERERPLSATTSETAAAVDTAAFYAQWDTMTTLPSGVGVACIPARGLERQAFEPQIPRPPHV